MTWKRWRVTPSCRSARVTSRARRALGSSHHAQLSGIAHAKTGDAPVEVEAEILPWILALTNAGDLALVHPAVIAYENSHNPSAERRIFIDEVMKAAAVFQNVNASVPREAARVAQQARIQPLDALHIAAATWAEADALITCDYALVER